MKHPIFARFYSQLIAPSLDKAGIGEHRDQLLAGLTGEVLEVGAGNGLNFSHYPAQVRRVVAVEPEPRLRELATRAAASAPVPVEVVDGMAERLPFAGASFDAAVLCLMMCSVTDQAATLAELRRVLRPGGTLRFFEHVQADTPGMRRVQRGLDATIWPVMMGGCHTGRDTGAAIAAAGFSIEDIDRFPFPKTRLPAPTAAHILGSATRSE